MAGLGAALNRGQVTRGDTVAVIGCGGVGNAAIAGARLAGAAKIIAIGIDDRKLDTARAMGATHAINSRATEPDGAVRDLTGGHMVIDAAGRPETYQQAFYARDLAGTAVLVGVPTPDMTRSPLRPGGRHYKTREKIVARIGVIAAKRRVTSCLRWTVTDNEDGTPVLAWHFDTGVLKAEAAVDGWYALLTSVPTDQADAGRALIHYRGQGAVERRYHDFKGPLAVAPVFVQHNRRVAALIQVICLALPAFCLIERQGSPSAGSTGSSGSW